MSKAYDFVKHCECFYVATMNNEFPAVRPFGAIMEVNDKIYIATHDGNEVHKQLRANGHIQIIAKKRDTREWLRSTGIAEECNDVELKKRFMEECPILIKHYGEATSKHYLMFKVTASKVEFK